MNIETIANQLGKAKHTSDGWICLCPAHDDQNPSLSLTLRNGKLLAHCHAGCPQDAVVEAIKLRGLWPSKTSGRQWGEGGGTPPKYDAMAQRSECTLRSYADAKGLSVEYLRELGVSEIVYMGAPVVKIPYKDLDGNEIAVRFRTALDGGDKFRWRKGDKPTLYGLERLLHASTAVPMTIVEGESDCQTLWSKGVPALGVPGATMEKEKYAPLLADYSIIYVVIEPDRGGEAMLEWIGKSSIRDRVSLVRLSGYKDVSEMYVDDPALFAERWAAALEAATPWQTEEEIRRKEQRAAAWRECHKLADCPNILEEFGQTLKASGFAGELDGAKLLYLIVVSRLFQLPISLAIKGPSAGGKTFLALEVLKYFPETAAYVLTAMSERALAYDTEPLVHRMLVVTEASGLSGEVASYLMRSLLSKGFIRYVTVVSTPNGPVPMTIYRPGPTGLIVTTTEARLDAELETRLLSMNIVDTPKQTAAIFRSIAEKRNLKETDFGPWHSFQIWLADGPIDVYVPYERALSRLVPPVSVRLRRDFSTLIKLCAAHALIHRRNRKLTKSGEVVANFDDYERVRELVFKLISEGVEASVPQIVRETVQAVIEIDAGDAGVSLAPLARHLKVDKNSASRRAKVACGLGYLRNLEERKGRPARYVIGDPMPDEVEILPSRERLERYCAIARKSRRDTPPSPRSKGAA